MLAIIFLNRMSMKRRAINASKQKEKLNKTHKIACCRTCLSTSGLVDIFRDKEMEKKRSDDLKIVTGLEIKYNDGLSQKMCTKCIQMMNLALQFRKKCRKAEKSLLDLALGTRDAVKRNNSKSLVLKRKSRVEKQKLAEDEIDFNCSGKQEPPCDNYNDSRVSDAADDWQNDDDVALMKSEDYRDYDEGIAKVKPKLQFSKKSAPEAKKSTQKKRMVIPNNLRCDTCNKEFRMKATYKAHMRFHTNYCVCETCGKRCRNNNQLQEHKRARHGLGKIHKCAYCEYSSATKEALTIHERRHTGERPYICDHCGATFHRRSNLVQHIAIHLPEKNFQCPVCNKYEKSKKLLQVHVFKVHREKRFKYTCPLCQDVFSRPYNVRLHLTRTHGVARSEQTAVIHRFEVPTGGAVDRGSFG